MMQSPAGDERRGAFPTISPTAKRKALLTLFLRVDPGSFLPIVQVSPLEHSERKSEEAVDASGPSAREIVGVEAEAAQDGAILAPGEAAGEGDPESTQKEETEEFGSETDTVSLEDQTSSELLLSDGSPQEVPGGDSGSVSQYQAGDDFSQEARPLEPKVSGEPLQSLDPDASGSTADPLVSSPGFWAGPI